MASPNVPTSDTIEGFRTKVNNHFNDATEHGGGATVTGGTAVIANTVAAMKALTGLTTGSLVKVRGYTAINDGGGGDFYYDSSSAATADEGLVVDANTMAGRFLRYMPLGTRWVNVKWFGAQGNYNKNTFAGADDTAEIQAAIDSVVNTYGATIYFPHGVYGISAPIDIPTSNYSVNLEGPAHVGWNEGPGVRWGATLCQVTPKSTCVRVRYGATSVAHAGPQFRNIHFLDGTNASAAFVDSSGTATGVENVLTNRTSFFNCTFRGLLRGINNNSRAYFNVSQPYGATWAASTQKLLGHAIVVDIGGTPYRFIVDAVPAGALHGTTGGSTPTFSATLGSTVVDNNLTWKNDGLMQSGGDASWCEIAQCVFLECRESIYVPHQGNIHLWGRDVFGPGAFVTLSCFVRIGGGGYHRIHDVKLEEVALAIDFYGHSSSIHDVVTEDCAQLAHFGANLGPQSGTNNNIDGFVITSYQYTTEGWTPKGVVCDSGTSGVIGPRRAYTNVAAGNRIQVNSGSWSVQTKDAVSSGFTE